MNLSNPINLIIASIYFVVVGIMVFFSIFCVYVLVRYGEKRSLSLVVTLLFCMFFLSILAQSYSTLQSIISN